jgi:hypothetical protein
MSRAGARRAITNRFVVEVPGRVDASSVGAEGVLMLLRLAPRSLDVSSAGAEEFQRCRPTKDLT